MARSMRRKSRRPMRSSKNTKRRRRSTVRGGKCLLAKLLTGHCPNYS